MNRKEKGSHNEDQEKSVSRARHENHCKICLHPDRAAIEEDWIGWGNTSRIAKEHGFADISLPLGKQANRMSMAVKRVPA